MKKLSQRLNTNDDSFSYTVLGEENPRYVVNSHAELIHSGNVIGRFRLSNDQWHLYLDGVLYMSGPENGLFKLPEFELEVLTALVNR